MTGLSTQTIGQAGEYLVAAELCRMGYVASTFTRNVPDFDILAMRGDNFIRVQVKTIAGATWQFDARKFIDFFEPTGDGVQRIRGKVTLPYPDMLLVMVKLDDKPLMNRRDEVFVLRVKDLQDVVFEDYRAYLEKHGGRRPKNTESYHTAVKVEHLKAFQDNWALIGEST
jgi:hypothetical protein